MSRAGRINNPRERMLRQLDEAFKARGWQEFAPIAEMAVLAMDGKQELERRQKAAQADAEAVAAGELDRELATPFPGNGDRQQVVTMFDRAARYLAPRLKEQELKVGGLDGGPVTVRFQRPEDDAPSDT